MIEYLRYKNLQHFSIDEYRKACKKINMVAHLHGSILMAAAELKKDEINKFAIKDDYACLYKYANYKSAKDYRLKSFRFSS